MAFSVYPDIVATSKTSSILAHRACDIISTGTAYDWHTVNYAFTSALPLITARLGLTGVS